MTQSHTVINVFHMTNKIHCFLWYFSGFLLNHGDRWNIVPSMSAIQMKERVSTKCIIRKRQFLISFSNDFSVTLTQIICRIFYAEHKELFLIVRNLLHFCLREKTILRRSWAERFRLKRNFISISKRTESLGNTLQSVGLGTQTILGRWPRKRGR